MTKAHLNIEGMHCGGCVTRVSTALKNLPGVTVDEVQVGSATIQYDEAKVTPPTVVQALEKIGFDAQLAPATR
jgi:copper chaperone CopZ